MKYEAFKMSTSFGISKKVPFTENMPSLVISNSHQKSWKKWKSQVESKLESNIFYKKKKKKGKWKRVYTSECILHLTVPSLQGPLVKNVSLIFLWLSRSWYFWRLSSLLCGISFNLDMFVLDRNITNVLLCSSDTQFWFVRLLTMFHFITWLKSCLPGFFLYNEVNYKMKLLFCSIWN